MNIDSQISAAVRQPRKRPAPSQRDQQIYLDYQTSGQLQSELAEQYELTQCRISQIIRRVEKWLQAMPDERSARVARAPSALADGRERSSTLVGSDEECTTDDAARQRLRSSLQFELLTTAARHALRHFKEPQKTVTHKKGTRAGKDIDETTERLLPPNLQCLKVVVQANNQLSRLEKQSAPASAQQQTDQQSADQEPTGDLGREYVEAWLTEQRKEAQRAGLIPQHCDDTKVIVHDFVSAVLGQPNDGYALTCFADEWGKKVVDRKSYDDQPPPVPPHNGWYYPMHDAHGKLVAWLSAEQVAGAISPDYQPMSRAPIEPAVHVKGSCTIPHPLTAPLCALLPTPHRKLLVLLRRSPPIYRNLHAALHLARPARNSQ